MDSALSALAEGKDPTPPANPERKYWRDFCKSAPIGRAYEFMATAQSTKQPMALNALCAKALSYLQGSGIAPQAAKDAVCDAALLSYGTEVDLSSVVASGSPWPRQSTQVENLHSKGPGLTL
ncbi:MAG: hypothetical protein M1115_07965 [Actinobacteria bacterium]|nr:hypothetical protein [Actinomycetota bacterium]